MRRLTKGDCRHVGIAPSVAMATIVANPGGGASMTSERHDAQAPQPAREHSGSQIASDLTGLPFAPLVWRTLVDTLIFTPRIAQDVITGTRAYFSPFRLFISLMGLHFAAIAFFGLPNLFSLETMLASDGLDQVEEAVAAEGHSVAGLSASLSRWGGILNWPILVIGMVPYLLVLKAFRPSVSWWHHVQCYLTANNAMLIASFSAMPLLIFDTLLFLVFQSLSAIVFFVALLRIGSGAFGLKPGLLTAMLAANLAATIPSTIFIFLLTMLAMDAILQLDFGLSFFDLLMISLDSGTPPAEAGPNLPPAER